VYEIIVKNDRKQINLPQLFWYDRNLLTLSFPKELDIFVCEMAGDSLPHLTAQDIEHRIERPIGTQSLSELAKGKREVAIVVDDSSRPTEASLIVPIVLNKLLTAGIKKGNIRFLMALGCHGAHSAEDFRKKLGPGIVEEFGVYNHNCYENCIEVGHTRSGLSLKINAELMKCDFKIGIGCILPHLYTGYSGGGKLFLPGMAHIDTIDRFHSFLTPCKKGNVDFSNPMVKEIEDAVKLIGIDYKIDVLVNTKGQIVDLFAGDPVQEYKQGIKKAKSAYQTEYHDGLNVVISNAHLKVNEGDIAFLMGLEAIGSKKGTCVIIMNSPSGQITHYLMRRFGKFVGGRQSETRVTIPEGIDVIAFSKFRDTTTFDPYSNKDRIIWENDWEGVMGRIQNSYRYTNIRLGIIPDGTIQYFADTLNRTKQESKRICHKGSNTQRI